MRQEIQELIDRLVSEIGRLEEENDNLREAVGLTKKMDRPEFWKYRNAYPFTLEVLDMNISTRAFNCLKSMDIDTVGELVSFTKSQLIKCRAMGRKSIAEIIEWLDRNKLTLGMWKDPERNYKW